MQCNNLISKAIMKGQVLKLPISFKLAQANNKNHIDINHMTKNGFETLGGSPDQIKNPYQGFNKSKNTNPRGYTIDAQNDDNPYRNPELNSFLTGFGSMDKPEKQEKPIKKKKKEKREEEEPGYA